MHIYEQLESINKKILLYAPTDWVYIKKILEHNQQDYELWLLSQSIIPFFMKRNQDFYPKLEHSSENEGLPDFDFWDNNSVEFPPWRYEMTDVCEFDKKSNSFLPIDEDGLFSKIEESINKKSKKSYKNPFWLIIAAPAVISRFSIDKLIEMIKKNADFGKPFQIIAFVAWTSYDVALLIIVHQFSGSIYKYKVVATGTDFIINEL